MYDHPTADGYEERLSALAERGLYRREAYDFALDCVDLAVAEAERRFGEDDVAKITVDDFIQAVRANCCQCFGLFSDIVLSSWGLSQWSDFGQLMRGLVDAGLIKWHREDRYHRFARFGGSLDSLRTDYLTALRELPAHLVELD